MTLPEELVRLLRGVPALSRAYLVGGCVRDSLLGIAQPEVRFGLLLHKAFEAQLEGSFTELEGALKWLDEQT